MELHRKRQLKRTALFIILICVFTAGGFWLRAHPLFTEEGGSWKKRIGRPDKPYEAEEAVFTAEAPDEPEREIPAAMQRFYTTERASVFTFSGLGNAEELQCVLEALESTDSRATFFVTAEETERFPDQIEAICRAGQHLGIGILPSDTDTPDALLKAMRTQAETLRSRYGADYEVFVRPAYDPDNAALLQAAADGGFRVLTELKEAVPEDVSRMTDADEVLSAVFRESERALQRGEIVHFQMGLFQYSDAVLGELIRRIADEKCVYPILPADEVAEHTEHQYVYPLTGDMILPAVKDKIYPGHLDGMTPEEAFEVVRSGYIGCDWVKPPRYFPGFSAKEARQMDRTGLVKNEENYVFLTFDDWGSDRIVDELLAVLRKHNATGTFLVRTNYVPGNPNLLRAIAAEGHTIGAHTHSHMPLSNEIRPNTYAELSEEQLAALQEDLVLCYDTLQSIVGDMTDADGKPSLSLLFRQPTLAVSKSGLTTVFDCGYTYAVAGSSSPDDYKSKDVKALADELRTSIEPGAILVLHFLDNAHYTPEALDQVLTELENKGSEYRFVGLNKVLD